MVTKLNDEMATAQLTLLEDRAWKLDPRTQEIGRRGVAEARAALRRATSGRAPQQNTSKAA